MREILFRGKAKAGYKCIAEGEWIEGSLFYSDNESGIVCQIATSYLSSNKDEPVMVVAYEVDPKTVCQYTGLTDKNGRKIFEGDIISVSIWNLSRDKIEHTGVVKYSVLSFVAQWIGKNDSRFLGSFKGNDPFGNPMSEIEVIGNIFDNPELIGE